MCGGWCDEVGFRFEVAEFELRGILLKPLTLGYNFYAFHLLWSRDPTVLPLSRLRLDRLFSLWPEIMACYFEYQCVLPLHRTQFNQLEFLLMMTKMGPICRHLYGSELKTGFNVLELSNFGGFPRYSVDRLQPLVENASTAKSIIAK